jgi:ketosteroid isomerase-like protein
MSNAVRDTVIRYFETVADLGSTEDDLRAVVHPDARFVEHPNPVVPAGAVRDAAESEQGFRAGKALLAEQSFELHEVLVAGDRAAVRGTWIGVVGVDAGPYTRGTRMVAHMGGFLTVKDDRILEHETFDCYEPFGTAASA